MNTLVVLIARNGKIIKRLSTVNLRRDGQNFDARDSTVTRILTFVQQMIRYPKRSVRSLALTLGTIRIRGHQMVVGTLQIHDGMGNETQDIEIATHRA